MRVVKASIFFAWELPPSSKPCALFEERLSKPQRQLLTISVYSCRGMEDADVGLEDTMLMLFAFHASRLFSPLSFSSNSNSSLSF
jgi:hypothetical protein